MVPSFFPKYIVLFLFVIMLGVPSDAHAYFDPGAGSVILQGLAAGLLALGLFWRRGISALRRMVQSKRQDQ